MEGQNHIAGLILKQLRGELDDLETLELLEWANASPDNEILYRQLTEPGFLQPEVVDFYTSNRRILEKIKAGISMPKVIPLWKKLTAVASIILVLSLSAYFLFNNKSTVSESRPVATTHDVAAPKETRAVITLADGTKVYLDSVSDGTIAQQSDVNVVKSENGAISYQPLAVAKREVVYNMLTNPRGSRVIDMTLSDGSHVWLNAGSSVKYPVAFVGNERKVEIIGEAYFEVTHDAGKPFVVSNGDVSVQVLGTHFNVNAYDDEESLRVTLLEGSVRVNAANKTVTIKPGEQAQVNGRNAMVVNKGVDLDEVMAWKNGRFYFSSADIKSIMRQVARWYDVDVVYEGKIPDGHFTGKPSRDLSASQMLKVVEYSGVKIKIEGKKVTVMQ